MKISIIKKTQVSAATPLQVPKQTELLSDKNIQILECNPFSTIIHISDVHIRPLQRHDEYSDVFERTYRQLTSYVKTKGSIIVLTGDIFDNKTVFKPETFKVCRDFLSSLAKICTTFVIAGNHDMLEHNTHRMDSLTPVCYDIPNLHYLKYSGLYNPVGSNIIFVVSSLYDKKFLYRSNINVSSHYKLVKLYHGSVVGALLGLDDKHRVTESEISADSVTTRNRKLNEFEGFDAVLLGDLHRHQRLAPNIVYAGSLIQQNISESLGGHGYVLWDITDFDNIFVEVPNDWGFVDIKCMDGEWTNSSSVKMPKYPYIRVTYQNSTHSQLDKIVESLPVKPHSVKFNPQDSIVASDDVMTTIVEERDEMELVTEEVKSQPRSAELIELHKKYMSSANQRDDNSSTVWKPLWIKFKNMFGYRGNKVHKLDFRNGVTTLSAPNFTGKTSLINTIMFALFGQIPGDGKTTTFDIINNSESSGFTHILITNGAHTYLIEKNSKSRHSLAKDSEYLKKLQRYDFEVIIWETDADGNKIKNLTETRKHSTDTTIKSLFGDIDDFLVTNLINTKFTLNLVTMTPAEQIKTLTKLFRLDVFRQYKEENAENVKALKKQLDIANGIVSGLKAALQKSSSDVDITSMKHQLALTEQALATDREKLSVLVPLSGHQNNEIAELKNRIVKVNAKSGVTDDDLDTKLVELKDSLENDDIAVEECNSELISHKLSVNKKQLAQVAHLIVSPDDKSMLLASINNKSRSDAKFVSYQLAELEKEIVATGIQESEPAVQLSSDQLASLKAKVKAVILHPLKKTTIEKLQAELENYGDTQDIEQDPTRELYELESRNKELSKNMLKYDSAEVLKPKPMHVPAARQTSSTSIEVLTKTLTELLETKGVDKLLTTLKNTTETGKGMYTITSQLRNELMELLETYGSGDDQIVVLRKKIDDLKHNEHVRELEILVAKWNYREHTQNMQRIADIQRHIRYIELKTELQKHQENLASQQLVDQIERQITLSTLAEMRSRKKRLQQELEIAIAWQKLDVLRLREENSIYEKQLEHQRIRDQIRVIEEQIANREIIERNNVILSRITELTKQNIKTMNEIAQVNNAYNEHQKRMTELTSQIAVAKATKSQMESIKEQLAAKSTEILTLEKELELHQLYDKIISNKGIPTKILYRKIKAIEENVNQIMRKFTNYSVEIIFDETKNTIFIITQNKLTKKYLSANKLSGYESLMLNIAFKRSLNRYSYNSKSAIIIIDEGFDCADMENFETKLPLLVQALSEDYAMCLAVSQRDLSVITDHTIKIALESGIPTIYQSSD